MNILDSIWTKSEIMNMYGEIFLTVDPSQDVAILGSYYVVFLSKKNGCVVKYKVKHCNIKL